MARDILLRIPPEKIDTLPLTLAYRLTDYKLFRMISSDTGSPFNLRNISMCSPAVSSSQRMSNCGHTPMILRISTIFSSTRMPLMMASPPDFVSAPMRMLMRVDFPAPFYPNSPTIYPFLSYTDTPESANTSPEQIFWRLIIFTKQSYSLEFSYSLFFLFLRRIDHS